MNTTEMRTAPCQLIEIYYVIKTSLSVGLTRSATQLGTKQMGPEDCLQWMKFSA